MRELEADGVVLGVRVVLEVLEVQKVLVLGVQKVLGLGVPKACRSEP